MKTAALGCFLLAAVILAVVEAAPGFSYMQHIGNLMRAKRQAEEGGEKVPSTIKYCTTDEQWPVECATCADYHVMSKDRYKCLPCPSSCMNCTEDFNPDETSAGTTTCTTCLSGYFLTMDNNNETYCETCASYCSGCSVKSECDSDKCIKTAAGQGTIYDATTKTCKMCASSCSACSKATECNSNACFDGYAFKSSTKTCDKCPDFCTSCSYSGDTLKCSACQDLYTVSADELSCSACPENCLECEIKDGSVACKDGKCEDRYVLESGLCPACDPFCKSCTKSGYCSPDSCDVGFGFVQDGTNSWGNCMACPAQCDSCTPDSEGNLDTCDKCAEGYNEASEPTCDICPENCDTCVLGANGKTQCKSNGCASGYAYRSSDGTCHKCPTNCQTCTWSTSLSDTKCSTCISEYAPRSSDGECYKCPDFCTQCTDTGSTTQCTYDYCSAGSVYKLSDKTCAACPGDCAYCYIDSNENVLCSQCNSGFVESTDMMSCLACPDNCNLCEYDTTQQSTLCIDQQCDTGYYRTEAGGCTSCGISNCDECFVDSNDDVQCSVCAEDYALKDGSPDTCEQCQYCDGTCTYSTSNSRAECGGPCDAGYVLYNTDKSCKQCPTGCDTCTTDGSTQTCSVGGCNDENFQVTADMCLSCPPKCTSCSISGNTLTCSQCETGYFKDGSGRCMPCPANCDSCTESAGEMSCSTCTAGWHDGDSNGICAACSNNCEACTDGSTCTTCADGYVKVSGACERCPDNCGECDDDSSSSTCDNDGCDPGYMHDGSTCDACADKCQVCDTAGECDGGSAYCLPGYAVNANADGCDSCPSGKNCRFCTQGESNCNYNQCEPGYTMNKDLDCVACPNGCADCYLDTSDSDKIKCYDGACKTGFAQQSDDTTPCLACPTNCLSCYASGGTARCTEFSCDPFCTGGCSADGQCTGGCIFGYSLVSNDCIKCDEKCTDGCSNAGECTGACVDGYGHKASDSTCVQCTTSKNCKNCDGATPGTCTECPTGFFLDSSGECLRTCHADANCLDGWCTQADNAVCQAPSDPSNDKQGYCLSGNWWDASANSGSGGCASGVTDCLIHSDATTCLRCPDGKFFDPSTNGNCATAIDGGNNNCLVGKDDDGTKCKICGAGYYPDASTELCVSGGPANCLQASDASTCVACNIGYYVKSDDTCGACTWDQSNKECGCKKTREGPDGSGACAACDQTACSDCRTDKSKCVTCNDGYMLDSTGTCQPQCLIRGQAYSNTNKQCVDKHSGDTCMIALFKDPDSTTADTVTIDGTTYAYCMDGFCQHGHIWAEGACRACKSSEATCYWDATAQDTVNLNSGCMQKDSTTGRGVASGDYKCYDCPKGCEVCSGSSSSDMACKASSCMSDYVEIDETDSDYPVCYGCHVGCENCGPLSSNAAACTDCDDGYTLLAADNTCFICPDNCKECTHSTSGDGSKSSCTTCNDGYALNSADGTCSICPDNCAECTYSSGSTVCKVNKCNSGYAQHPTDYSCIMCPTNCGVCVYDSTNSPASACVKGGCNDGTMETESNGDVVCTSCSDSNCNECLTSDTSVCLGQQCATKYGLTSTRLCTACKEGCDECEFDSAGVETCKASRCSQYYARDDATGTCHACPENCNQCTYDAGISNTKCDAGHCATKYAQNVGADRYDCVACPDNCQACTYDSASSTTKCTNLQCDSGYANADDGSCGACSSNCVSCTTNGPGLCDTCESYFRKNTDNTCESCASKCFKCTSAGKGLCDSNSCDSRYVVHTDNTCKACDPNCKKCNTNGAGKCDSNQCDDEYVYTATTMTCLKCPTNCHECTVADDGVTTQCKDNQCYNGYGLKVADKKCYACSDNCLKCEDTNENGELQCTDCNTGFVINDGVCGACPRYCKTCSYVVGVGQSCSECFDLYALDDSKVCQTCPTNCKECTYDTTESKTMCMPTMCNDGYSRQVDGTCKRCQDAAFANCIDCTDQVDTGNGTASPSKCLECQSGYTMADDMLSCKSCAFSADSNCATCFDKPGKYCAECDSGYLKSENQEVCGKTCHVCKPGSPCEKFSSANMLAEVCDACWVIGVESGGALETFRGCLGSKFNVTCDSNFKGGEYCMDVADTKLCGKCCEGTNCNNFDLISFNSAVATKATIVTMLAMAMAAIFNSL